MLLLQATSPTVNSSDISDAIKKGIETDADTVISCYKLENEHPSLMYYSGEKFLRPVERELQKLRRQEQPRVWVRTGLLYLIKVSSFLKSDNLIGRFVSHIEIEKERSIAIDTYDDWNVCEEYLMGLK